MTFGDIIVRKGKCPKCNKDIELTWRIKTETTFMGFMKGPHTVIKTPIAKCIHCQNTFKVEVSFETWQVGPISLEFENCKLLGD